jgi:alkanesulfonate monooxygenase SsuD/methylene tetrahydromethanopterin reductase-like flavin-dependent oxidoreductase (luciferase family)
MHHLSRRYDRPEALKLEPFGEESVQRLIVGPPNTVVDKLQEAIAATGMNYMLCIFSFGTCRRRRRCAPSRCSPAR